MFCIFVFMKKLKKIIDSFNTIQKILFLVFVFHLVILFDECELYDEMYWVGDEFIVGWGVQIGILTSIFLFKDKKEK